MLNLKGHVLHHVVLHLKVSGWLSDLNSLLTRERVTYVFVAFERKW